MVSRSHGPHSRVVRGLWEGTFRMNLIISSIVGALAAGAVLVGGVQAAQPDQKPVNKSDLYSYSSE